MQNERVVVVPRSVKVFHLAGFFRCLVCLVAVSQLLGCSVSQPAAQRKVNVDVMKKQIVQDLQVVPTRFLISVAEDNSAWARAQLFFKMYVNEPDKVVHGSRSGINFITNVGVPKEKYQYTISRAQAPKGFDYSVKCNSSSALVAQCDSNAKNVARFVREGQLELSHFAR